MVVPFKAFKQTSEKTKEELHDEIKQQMSPQMFLRMLKIEALAKAKEDGTFSAECVSIKGNEDKESPVDIDSKLN